MFIGSLGDKVLIAAIGLGNIFQNMLAEATFCGLNGAFDTLFSQAFGAKDLTLCGRYLWRGRIINTFVFVVLLIPFWVSTSIFVAVGMNEAVSLEAGRYILAYAPAMYLNSL